MAKSFLDILKEKIVVFDGAMGTNIQAQNLHADDFGGDTFNGCNEYLVLTKSSAVAKVHADFFEAGCDVVETDSFGSTSIVLAEYGIADKAYVLNYEAAKLAKGIAADFSTSSRPRFVAGSLGPTTKLPSLGHIGFKDMEAAYYMQAKGLVEGGADLLSVETCQDLLQAKAALAGVFGYFADARTRVPVIASVTIETMGTMLLGTEIAAALTALEPFDVDIIGMNCATGPKEMSENIRYLCANSPKHVFVMPNAGIPENVGGHAHYKLTPDELVHFMEHFVKDLGVRIVGGCCGTTKEHLKKLVDAVGSLAPAKRTWEFTPSSSSLYQSVPHHIDPAPVIIGERTNANGSKLFRDLLAKEDWEGLVAMGKDQAREGAHVIDVCTAYVGRDESRDMRELIYRLNTQVTVPIMIDSTEYPVIEEALQRIAGKAIVNSINMEDGEERMEKVLPLCRKYGAAVVALTIDESGMAKTAQRKLEIARRIYKLATEKYGVQGHDIIFDTLTFTLGSGDEEFRKSGIETIEAIRLIKKEFPDVHTSLGVSNISFGLSPHARHVLNSVFLHYAIEYGLDMAIVHASKILPLYKISEREREICRKLIFDERTPDYDPLQDLLAYFSDKKGEVKKQAVSGGTIEVRLKNRIIDGNKVNIQAELDEGLKKYPALEIINDILLAGMKVVGELFGSGQMQLPFVLQSAEAMKSAVAYLEKFMDKSESSSKGTMVIATVKGDVHDIGKNLVDIILTNNGYKVINLGIQCPLERMLTAFDEQKADAIGMSGLLVKSTLIMKENLQVMNERELHIPVILGGAALTRRYVEQDLRAIYKGSLSYANDAFDGLHFMQELAQSVKDQRATTEKIPTIDGVLAEMEKSQKEMLSLLETLSDEQFERPNAFKEWSVHDVVAHLVAWEGICADRIRLYLDGRKDEIRWFPDDQVSEKNAQLVRERKGKTRSDLMSEWLANRRSVVELVRKLQPDDLQFSFGGGTLFEIIAENTFRHQLHHSKSISAWLKADDHEEESALSGLEAKIALAPREMDAIIRSKVGIANIPRPPFFGSKVIDDVPLGEIYPYLNEIALIRGQWQVRKGKLSDSDYQLMLKEKVYPDFERLKREAKERHLLQPKVVYGYFPCQAEGDDLIVYQPVNADDAVGIWKSEATHDVSHLKEAVRFTFPRQTKGRLFCISDFFSSRESGNIDVVGFHLVTMGKVASDYAHELFQSNNYKEYLYFHGLSVETAEALAELWHRNIRQELGIGTNDAQDVKKLFSQHYQGSRYSFGYPACPSLEDQEKLFQLLRPERIGVTLTEEFQLVPEQSTSAIIVHHPEAKYFNI